MIKRNEPVKITYSIVKKCIVPVLLDNIHLEIRKFEIQEFQSFKEAMQYFVVKELNFDNAINFNYVIEQNIIYNDETKFIAEIYPVYKEIVNDLKCSI